jgi:RND family efflux transporter MFP subunit
MGRPLLIVSGAVIAAISFVAGSWYTSGRMTTLTAAGRPRVLYYHDPMHPAYRSGKPGVAPDCGMQLEPVYADASGKPVESAAARMPGAIFVGPERAQLIGIRTAIVERSGGHRTVRTIGRVAADETRVFRLTAATEGWIRESYSNSTGSLVEKGQPLATMYSREFLGAEQAYLYSLDSLERIQAAGPVAPQQLATSQAQILANKEALQALGMSDRQIAEIARTRKVTEEILLLSPAKGFIVTRNVSPGQRFERGVDFFRVADLSQVWILADVFENDATDLRPGAVATVRYHGNTLAAHVSDVLPQFDGATRTMKARLELDNARYVLRPDMFVDIDLPATSQSGIAVPADAVIDSGLHKTVFIEAGSGSFEPRAVETGWRMGDRVQITRGLEAGERIVVSGNFLLDSESRMKLTAVRAAAAGPVKDPACGMEIDLAKATEKSEYRGKTYYFCSKGCKEQFDKNPEQYLGKQQVAQGAGS